MRCTELGRFEVASGRPRELAKFVQEVAGGGHAASGATVGALVGQWFELAKADLSPSTVRGYERSIRRYIQPALGDVPLQRLRVAQLDRHYAQLRERGGHDGGPLATDTVRQVHAILRRALQQGVKWGWIESNPATLASPPRVTNRQIEAPDPAAVVRLIDEARSESPDLAAFLQLAATTGARRGELCGLHWNAVDFERGSVTIARSIVDGTRGALIEKDTKTHSVRRIALDQTSMQILGEHRERCRDRAGSFGVRLRDSAYVFSRAPDCSTAWPPNDVTHEFIRLRDRLGLDTVRLHDYADIRVMPTSGRIPCPATVNELRLSA